MSGMAMMLKAMGFDADEMQRQAKAAIEYCNHQQKYFDEQIKTILHNQQLIMSALNISAQRVNKNEIEVIKQIN